MKASDLSNKNGIIAHKTPDLIDIDEILKKISDLSKKGKKEIFSNLSSKNGIIHDLSIEKGIITTTDDLNSTNRILAPTTIDLLNTKGIITTTNDLFDTNRIISPTTIGLLDTKGIIIAHNEIISTPNDLASTGGIITTIRDLSTINQYIKLQIY